MPGGIAFDTDSPPDREWLRHQAAAHGFQVDDAHGPLTVETPWRRDMERRG